MLEYTSRVLAIADAQADMLVAHPWSLTPFDLTIRYSREQALDDMEAAAARAAVRQRRALGIGGLRAAGRAHLHRA